MEFAAFCLAVAVIYCAYKAPDWLRAQAESRCEHAWELLRHGDVVKDERKVGAYNLYRCTKCGASRHYDTTH